MKRLSQITLLYLFSISCNRYPLPEATVNRYSIAGNTIYHSGNPVQLIGANAMHVFAAGSRDMNSWQLDIAREFIGNVKETPLTGGAIQDANGSYLYSLQTIVDSNRINNRVTILCPFGWDGQASTEFTGRMPAATPWWNDFKIKLQQWAAQFASQQDVWIEVWNEPYRFDRADGYTDDIWMSNMNDLVSIIRNAGNPQIILVPCAEQGQDEGVLLNKGTAFLNSKSNILFDIHAYEKWLLQSSSNISARLQQLKQLKLPVIFGETAPMNAGVLMNPAAFTDSAYNNGFSIAAWLWKYDAADTDALLNAQGLPNNNNNNNWGSLYKTLSLKPRKP